MSCRLQTTAWVLVFAMLSASSAIGQGVQVEAYVGLSFASMNGTEEASGSSRFVSRITFPFGVNLDFPLSENVLLGTGLGYSPRGTDVENLSYSPYPGTSLTVTGISLNYIDMPLLLVIAPSTFRLFVGPQISFLTSADVNGTDISNAIEGTSFGIRYGLGFDGNSLAFRLTGQNGVTDVYKHPTREWTTHAYTLSVGYLFAKRGVGGGTKSRQKKDDVVPAHRKIDF